ncbi:MAG: tetratricopeptide repeat protein [Burkholderiaceae bacterium]
MQTYTLRSIESMLGLSRAVITGLIEAGFVTPGRGKRREYLFSFQDVVLLRTAYGLQAARIAPRRIVRSLQKLKAALPSELPLSGLRIAAVGNDVAVREGGQQWSAETGQLLIDFEVRPASGEVEVLGAMRHTGAATVSAAHWFERGVALEASDPAQAEAAYRRALTCDPGDADVYLNLSVLLCDSGRAAQAAEICREGLTRFPNAAWLYFNLGVALEDMGRHDDALRAYQKCLRIEPGLADAHYNAARLHERSGHAAQAIRHYGEYRRLQ